MKKRSITKFTSLYAASILLSALITGMGCHGGGGGGGGSATAPSGKVTLGDVTDSIVFADHASGTECDFEMDTDEGETSTTSDESGKFELPATPGFSYTMVAQGGTDTLTGEAAPYMLAPAGARNITPLTTLVALNPNIKTSIESLGIAYDEDLTRTITPAAALLVQSIQATVGAATDALNPGGNSLPLSAINDIQRTIMAEIANEIQTVSPAPLVRADGATALSSETMNQLKVQLATQLTNTTTLTTTLTTAITRALTRITQRNTNITISNIPQVAQQIAGPIVDTIASSIAQSTGSFTFSTTTTASENTIITTVAVTNIRTTRRGVVGTISISITVIPPVDVPPVLSGTPAATAAVGVRYSFVPTVTDPDADKDVFIFSIVNKPSWARFNRATGALTGTPGARDVGTTTGIVISVKDGINTASLPPFSIQVYVPTGSTGGTGGSGGL